jgi:hypothetical protein
MRRTLITAAMAQVIVFGAAPAANAISVELAKKCRDMAIKSHPPPLRPGGKAYAQAEREFFRDCVSRNGEMPEANSPETKPGRPSR